MTTTINKVVYGQTILLDLTSDTVTADHLDSGYTAHDANGAAITGTNTRDADTSDATALAADILSGLTAYANGEKLTGTMTNRGAVSGTINTASDSYTIPQGYHNGSGSVSIDPAEQSKIIPENIKSGVSILGVAGSHSGSADTVDATASAADILSGQTAYANGEKLTGTMTDNGAVNGTIDAKLEIYTIPQGYHNGSGSVSIASDEQSKIIPENIKSGVSILGIAGSHSGTADTSDATASAADILSGQTAYVNGEKLTGTMVNNGAINGTIDTKSGAYTVPEGYHNGNGSVSIDSAEQAKIISENIKSGVSILGVTGTLGAFTILEPIAFDFADGYVAGASGWTYQANSNNRADVYQVSKDHTYFCRLGDTVSERWRGCFTTANPVTATGDLSGSCVVYHNEDNVPKRACFAYKPRVNGYITIVKTRSGVNNIPTYMYDITGFDLLLSVNGIAGLSVTQSPARTVYDSGERIDYAGMVVTATYSDGSTADVTSYCTVTPSAGKAFDPSTDTTVTITYRDTATSLTLTVGTLTGISVTRNPSKATYKPGESVDYTDMVVTATYSNGSTADVTSYCLCSPAQGETVSDTATITYAYGSNSKSCTLSLTIAQYQLYVYSTPTKTTYDPNEGLDLAGARICMLPGGNEEIQDVTPLCSFTPVVDGDRTIVTVSCAPPKGADITGIVSGRVEWSEWTYDPDSVNQASESYRVTAGHQYYLYAGATTGTDKGVNLRAIFTTTDVSQATSNVPGDRIVNALVSENERFTYTPTSDGYITITSTLATRIIPSYLYDAENPNKIITTTFTLTTVS